MDKYVIDTQATVIDIEDEKWLIVLNTFDYGSPEAKHLASDELWRLSDHHRNFVTGMKRPDGTYGFACSGELQEKIASSTSIMGISSEVSPTCRLRSRAW